MAIEVGGITGHILDRTAAFGVAPSPPDPTPDNAYTNWSDEPYTNWNDEVYTDWT